MDDLLAENAHGRLRSLTSVLEADRTASTDSDAAVLEWHAATSGVRTIVAIESHRDRRIVVLKEAPTVGDPSFRQAQILTRLSLGYSLKQLSAELSISLSTASRHVHEATRKLGHDTPFSVAMSLAPWAHFARERASTVEGAGAASSQSSIDLRVSRVWHNGEQLVVVGFSMAETPSERALTPAEAAVAELVSRGLSNGAIARARCRSPRTIANQLAGLFLKLGVHSRMELALLLGRGVAMSPSGDETRREPSNASLRREAFRRYPAADWPCSQTLQTR